MKNDTEKVVVIAMLTEDLKNQEMIIRNSRTDLMSTDDLAESAREHALAIVEADVILTSAGRHFIDLNNLFYRETQDTPIVTPNVAKAHQLERLKKKNEKSA